MWRLTEIKIRNIVSIHEAALKINQGVATLIFGRNEDNASQPCNGSGKSSLLEAISLALTGEQLRKVKSIDEIINDHADEAYTFLRLDNDYDDTVFTIERNISRNAPQSIECHKYNATGEEIETDKTIQPTVSDYNKFILNEIGLSKDDIYNNFILCDNKYESFFDCSDKNKKEVINRFSNGVIVDESIARVQADMEPVAMRLKEANESVINIKGSISAIENELDQVDEKKATAKEEREARIKRLDSQIQQCREEIEVIEGKIVKGEARLNQLHNLQDRVVKLEGSDISLLEAYTQIKELCEKYELNSISDYDRILKQNNQLISDLSGSIQELKNQIIIASEQVKKKKAAYEAQKTSYNQLTEKQSELTKKDQALIEKINAEVDKLDRQLDKIELQIKSHKKRQAELETLIARNSAILNGAVTCPKCEYQFIIGNQVTVDEVKADLAGFCKEMDGSKSEVAKLTKEFDALNQEGDDKASEADDINRQIKARHNELNNHYLELSILSKEVDSAENTVATFQKQLISSQNELDRMNGKVEVLRSRLYGEINGILEGRIMGGENFILQQESSLKFTQGQMSQYQQSKRELLETPETDFATSLKASLEKYQENLEEAEDIVYNIQAEYNRLKEQEVNFTMFKSHIARKKIDALSLIVNDFLEKIGSDIRLKLEGFTVTKTGKLRDKISVQVMRDGIDCGSYHKFSGGEKARLNLACILSLHTLINSNCEEGKGLDCIIIDELLDKSDEMGMSTYCEALNKLGQTALLITQGGVAESYPHKLLIVKKQGVSTICN